MISENKLKNREMISYYDYKWVFYQCPINLVFEMKQNNKYKIVKYYVEKEK